MTEDLGPVIRDIQEKVTISSTLLQTILQPGGRIPRLEEDVKDLNEFKIKSETSVRNTATFYSVITGAAALAGHFIWDFLRGGKH